MLTYVSTFRNDELSVTPICLLDQPPSDQIPSSASFELTIWLVQEKWRHMMETEHPKDPKMRKLYIWAREVEVELQ